MNLIPLLSLKCKNQILCTTPLKISHHVTLLLLCLTDHCKSNFHSTIYKYTQTMISQSDQDSPHYLDWSSLSLRLDDCNLERKIKNIVSLFSIHVVWYLQDRFNSINTHKHTKTNSNWTDRSHLSIGAEGKSVFAC